MSIDNIILAGILMITVMRLQINAYYQVKEYEEQKQAIKKS